MRFLWPIERPSYKGAGESAAADGGGDEEMKKTQATAKRC